MKNIGGSFFSSSSPEILRPIKFKNGILKVEPDYFNDTHYLYFNNKSLASHPNGYSCYAFATRLISGDKNKIKEQADYIVRCGGEVDYTFLEELIQEKDL